MTKLSVVTETGRSTSGEGSSLFSNKAKGKIVHIEMPTLCPEVTANLGSGTTMISLYIVDRCQINIASEHLDWAVQYLYTQNRLRGMPLVEADDTGLGDDSTTPAPTTYESSSSSSQACYDSQ